MGSKIVTKDSLAVRTRPKRLGDLIGQEKTVNVLKGYISRKQMPKTILFAGRTGSGKTTLARIVNRIVNCSNLDGYNPCLKCPSCLASLNSKHPDFLEVNGASERGIDDIRAVVKQSYYAPKYNMRVILIDEAHGLTSTAINALLKPIEEPPPKTIWIFGTTEPEKLKEVILGRCARNYLDYPTVEEVVERLAKISRKEFGVKIHKLIKPYYEKIAESSGLQPRNAVQTLEMVGNLVSAKKSVDKKGIEELLKKTISSLGEIDSITIKLLGFLYRKKLRGPMVIFSELEQERIDEMLILAHRYSYYAATYLLSKAANEKVPVRSFFGLNRIRFEAYLNKLDITNPAIPLFVCSCITKTMERIRTGLVSKEQAFVSMLYEISKEFSLLSSRTKIM